MTNTLTTYEIKTCGEISTIRTTRDGLLSLVRASRPDATIVKFGYTTWRLYSEGRCYGSVREIG